jgi:hypothetical protein
LLTDVRNPGLAIALGTEELVGGVEDLPPCLLLLFLA